jgi:hypothetical protein
LWSEEVEAMYAFKHHLAHHRRHMLGCGAGILVAVLGAALGSPPVAIAGAVICGVFCFSMVRMMVMRPHGS